jgi:hypothetical protein
MESVEFKEVMNYRPVHTYSAQMRNGASKGQQPIAQGGTMPPWVRS